MLLVTGDDVVAYKHGEKSAHTLSSAGFRNLTFKAYNGYVSILVSSASRFVCLITSNKKMGSWQQAGTLHHS